HVEPKRRRETESSQSGERVDDNADDEEESSEGDEYNAFEDDELSQVAPEHEHLKADVREAARTFRSLEDELGIPSVQIEVRSCVSGRKCSVALTLNVSNLPDMVRHLWELGTALSVSVIIDDVDKAEFRACDRLPIVLARLDSEKPSKFPVGECLMNVS
ncbi:hypothetical protein PMAYCL1PPCAC_25802, partial [Pristionchus mayeri]